MTIEERIRMHALMLAGKLSDRQNSILMALCHGASVILTGRLRDGLTPDDCVADFVAAASLMALAAMSSVTGDEIPEQITVADFTVKTAKSSGDTAANCLRTQAELIMAPYIKDRFTFLGV